LGGVRVDDQACTACGSCAAICPTDALKYEREDDHLALTFDPALCVACGRCYSQCPEKAAGAIGMTRITDLREISEGRRTLLRSQETLCERCGAPVATRAMLARIAVLLGDDYSPQYMERLCTECRGI
jgi:formate hydrogenlyase subunit 6/NADH:ubiquinone oxidoreductase subunit I